MSARWLLAFVAAGGQACAAPRPNLAAGGKAAASFFQATPEPAQQRPAAEPDAAIAEQTQSEEGSPSTCSTDLDCGYDPSTERCGSDPRYNRQPPIVDQGILCYCEANACATLRVTPVPCEGDDDCTVQPAPRPHPTRATKTLRHEAGRACRDFTLSTSCERTNICTMHRLRCGSP